MKKYIQHLLICIELYFIAVRRRIREKVIPILKEKIEDKKDDIERWYRSVEGSILFFSGRIKKTCQYWKLSKNLYDFDYDIVLRSEQHHLRLLYNSIDKYRNHVNAPMDLSWINRCIKLLDYIIDNTQLTYDHDNGRLVMTKYCNLRNYKRFMPNVNEKVFESEAWRSELYELKAWRLYHAIRENYMLRWWD